MRVRLPLPYNSCSLFLRKWCNELHQQVIVRKGLFTLRSLWENVTFDKLRIFADELTKKHYQMKKSTFLKVFGLLALIFVVSSCNKYEEGSNFSLITAKGRLANTWTIQTITYTTGSTTTTITGTTGTVTVNKDGTWSSSTTYTIFGQPVTDNDAGTWVLNSDKTQVIMTDNENGDVRTFAIIKLKNKELALTETDANGNVTRTDYTGS